MELTAVREKQKIIQEAKAIGAKLDYTRQSPPDGRRAAMSMRRGKSLTHDSQA
ncbi:MAG UNVERIFIED_CONTAM: hypothetical protein LVQ98_09415 [Rickettsiaceae bacterium]